MSSSVDVNKSFTQLACFVIGGGIISSIVTGRGGDFFGALVICYFMLVATNAIRRGENSKQKR